VLEAAAHLQEEVDQQPPFNQEPTMLKSSEALQDEEESG